MRFLHIFWYAASPAASGFFTGPVVQGPEVDWQCPASLVVSTPFFLAAQRRTASTVKKKLPKGTPWKGFLWTLPETDGPWSLWHPGATRYRDFPSWALLRTFKRSIVGGTTDLLDPTWRKANFLWKFLCAGSPPARIFAEQKCLAAAKDCRFAARQLDR